MKIDIRDVMSSLNINGDDFWGFLEGKEFARFSKNFSWGCFPIYDNDNILVDIRVLVPRIVDEKTLLVNIHELAHAYTLYSNLGKKYELNEEVIEENENFARAKEAEYLKLSLLKKTN